MGSINHVLHNIRMLVEMGRHWYIVDCRVSDFGTGSETAEPIMMPFRTEDS